MAAADLDRVAGRAVGDALQLVDLVRNYGPDAIHALIDRWDDDTRRAALIALAAAVDPDRRPSELWGWLGPVPRITRISTSARLADVWTRIGIAAKRREVDERRLMVSQLTAAGYTASEIGARLDVSQKVIERDRAANNRLREAS